MAASHPRKIDSPFPPSPSISLALAGWSAIKNEWSGLLSRAVVVCDDGSGSSIYRGSSYESSWETRVSPVVAGFFCRAAQRLRQSSATASCCASTTAGAYLSDPGRHPGGGRYVCGRTSHSAYHHHSLCHAVAGRWCTSAGSCPKCSMPDPESAGLVAKGFIPSPQVSLGSVKGDQDRNPPSTFSETPVV